MLLKPQFRCSGLDRVITCHGACSLDARFPQISKDSEVSVAGSRMHAVGAKRLIAAGALGVADPIYANDALEGFDAWITEFWVTTVLDLVPMGWALEVESEMGVEFARFFLSGHIDVLAISPDGTEAMIFDLKTGYNPVDPADCNWQLAGYAALLRVTVPTVQRVKLVIVQPRNNPDEGYERVSEADVDFGAADVSGLIEQELNAVLDDPFTFCTAKKACAYCPFPISCPATKALKKAMKTTITKEAFDEIAETPTLEQLAEWARDGKIIEKATDSARERLKAELKDQTITLEDGTRVYLKDAMTPRACTNVTTLRTRVGVVLSDEAALNSCFSPSFGEIEKAVAKKLGTPVKSKDQAKMSGEKWVKTNLGDLYTQEPTKKLTIS